MKDITLVNVETMKPYTGPHEIPGIRFKPARRALGVTAWGMNVIELDPHCDGCPEHDHVGDGQEEVYVVLRGAIVLQVGGEETTLREGDFVRVPPQTTRKLVTRAQGATMLAIGGTPGAAYTPTIDA